MAMDKFEEVNADEERENAREQRAAWMRARWRAHPVWFTIVVVLVLYAVALGNLILKPGHPHGPFAFLGAGIVTLIVFVFLLVRLFRKRRPGGMQSNWT